MTRKELARIIDHTLLKVDARRKDIERLCEEALRFEFFSVCVNPCWVGTVSSLLKGTGVKVCSASGFPLGASTADVKVLEAKTCMDEGADEVDMVMNVGAFKDGQYGKVREEIESVVRAVGSEGVTKVIIETCVLSEAEKREASLLVKKAGAHFVKTSTGFGRAGAVVGDVRLIRDAVGPQMGVKASGGIRTLDMAAALVKAGANRIGTSAGMVIMAGPGTLPVGGGE
jgi:deoxyribose-phosphate aldolase